MLDKKLMGMILIVVGVILLYFGWNSSESVGEQLTETVTGRFTDDTMLLIVGGAVALVAGIYLAALRK